MVVNNSESLVVLEGTVDEIIRRIVLQRYKQNDYNKLQTAKQCGVSLKTLYNWLKKWQMQN